MELLQIKKVLKNLIDKDDIEKMSEGEILALKEKILAPVTNPNSVFDFRVKMKELVATEMAKPYVEEVEEIVVEEEE